MPKQRILVFDDDPDLVRALRLRLRANNYDITTPSDGYSVIASAQKDRPDLIVLDLGLPAGDGFVVLDRLQNSDVLSGVPVIVLSARDPQGNEERALKAGAAAFFQKPADNEDLLNVIRVSLPPCGDGDSCLAVLAHPAAFHLPRSLDPTTPDRTHARAWRIQIRKCFPPCPKVSLESALEFVS
jgi:DNA-binding response OmpR family regulator